jgi:hypothetical protein
MHYLGKEQPFIKGMCGLFGAVWFGTGPGGKREGILGGYGDSILIAMILV